MSQAEAIGFAVLGLAAILSLFFAMYKPLNENTKTMTVLTVKVEQLTAAVSKSNIDMEEYKEKVKEGQRRQWVELDKHSEKLLVHDVKIQALERSYERLHDKKLPAQKPKAKQRRTRNIELREEDAENV